MHLWEVLWTEIPCPAFLLLFCVAILDGQVNMIIENKFGLTEILKVCPWFYDIFVFTLVFVNLKPLGKNCVDLLPLVKLFWSTVK